MIDYLAVKRVIDVVFSLLAMALSAPIMLLTALAVKLEDGGPVLYRQIRLTKDGREFSILKFRSMGVDAERDGVARLCSAHDERLTKVGRLIRPCHMDELPQLFNILKGDMSLVGPRPERPEIARQYEISLPEFSLRLQVKAGLTGLAQIYGGYHTTPSHKLQMDLLYIHNLGFLTDLKLIAATFKILFAKAPLQGQKKRRPHFLSRE